MMIHITLLVLYFIRLIICDSLLESMEAKSRQRRVVNGYPTTIESYPYMVSLKKKLNRHACGGTIIDDKTILTAAHCLATGEITSVRVGSSYVDSEDGVLHNISDYILHELYVNELYPINDIALMRLEVPIAINNITTRMVKLADRDTSISMGDNATSIGWGLIRDLGNAEINDIILIEDGMGGWTSARINPDQLRAVDLQIIAKSQCEKSYTDESLDNRICTHAPGKDFCSGDSGGPVMVGEYQVGIVSWNSMDCASKPGISTEVAPYRDWILEKIKEWDTAAVTGWCSSRTCSRTFRSWIIEVAENCHALT